MAQDKVLTWKKKKKKKKKYWANSTIYNINRNEAHPSHDYGHRFPVNQASKIIIIIIIIKIYTSSLVFLALTSCMKPNLEVGEFVEIKILWWIRNRPIVHDKIFVIKLIFNWWRGWSTNEIKPCGNIKWKKPYGGVRRKDLYKKFLLNEIPN